MIREPSLPHVIDSTMLVAFRGCHRKFFLEFCHNLSPTAQSPDLHFGGAVAHGMERARKAYFVDGLDARKAELLGVHAACAYYGDFTPPEKSAKTWENLLAAMKGYFIRWPLDTDPAKPHKGIIEFTFAVPILGTKHPVTGDPFLYGGRYDMMAEFEDMLTIVDEKTQGRAFEYNWSDKWALRNQFMGYTWASRFMGFPIQRTLIRGISILKSKVDFMPAFATYTDTMLERFHYQLTRDVQLMAKLWQEQYFDYNFGDTCTAYSGCPFQQVCVAQEPAQWYSMFKERNWDPIRQNPIVHKEAA